MKLVRRTELWITTLNRHSALKEAASVVGLKRGSCLKFDAFSNHSNWANERDCLFLQTLSCQRDGVSLLVRTLGTLQISKERWCFMPAQGLSWIFFNQMCLLKHRAGYEQQAVSLIVGESLPKLMTFFPVSSLLAHPRLETPFKESVRFMFHVGEKNSNERARWKKKWDKAKLK